MLSSANPAYQQAIVSKMADPAKMKRWVEALSRPDSFVPKVKIANPVTAPINGSGRTAGQEWLKLPADKTPPANARYRY